MEARANGAVMVRARAMQAKRAAMQDLLLLWVEHRPHPPTPVPSHLLMLFFVFASTTIAIRSAAAAAAAAVLPPPKCLWPLQHHSLFCAARGLGRVGGGYWVPEDVSGAPGIDPRRKCVRFCCCGCGACSVWWW